MHKHLLHPTKFFFFFGVSNRSHKTCMVYDQSPGHIQATLFQGIHLSTGYFLNFSGRPTVLRAHHGYIGIGNPKELGNVTSSPNNYWRIICPSVNYEVYIVLMGAHLAPNANLHVKTTKFEGCTDKYHGRHFHKRSILIGYFSNSAVMSAFKMAYVCVCKLLSFVCVL